MKRFWRKFNNTKWKNCSFYSPPIQIINPTTTLGTNKSSRSSILKLLQLFLYQLWKPMHLPILQLFQYQPWKPMYQLNHQQMIIDRPPDASIIMSECFDNEPHKSPIKENYNQQQTPDLNVSIKPSKLSLMSLHEHSKKYSK